MGTWVRTGVGDLSMFNRTPPTAEINLFERVYSDLPSCATCPLITGLAPELLPLKGQIPSETCQNVDEGGCAMNGLLALRNAERSREWREEHPEPMGGAEAVLARFAAIRSRVADLIGRLVA